MKPYIVYTPDFDVTSGGIRVMWGLYGWLLAKGQIVHVNGRYDRDFIGIYPEIVHDNPLGAKTVVRYILNKPGVMSSRGIPGPVTFDDSDKLYVFSELFNTVKAPESHKMFLPILDTHLFKDQGKLRTKRAVFVGKGTNKHLHPEGCLEIDRTLAHDQQYLADLLNECEVLYSYDPVSAMTEIARLCGVRVVMFNDTYSKKEYEDYEPGMNGISWGEDTGVKLNLEMFRAHYKEMVDVFSKKLDGFIEETQK